jgi:hypothetical protein
MRWHGLPADVRKRGWLLCTFTRERSQAASYAHGRWNRKKEGSVGEKGAESDGGAWGEIRNEREEKPSADEIRGTVSGVWLCIVMATEKPCFISMQGMF